MGKYTYTAELSETEFHRLLEIADKTGMEVGELIHQAVLDLIENEQCNIDFSQDASFGVWKDHPGTDEELLHPIDGGRQ